MPSQERAPLAPGKANGAGLQTADLNPTDDRLAAAPAVGGPRWREHLHRLEGLGLVLLPIGARPPDRKAPVDPATGHGLESWQEHPGFTAAAIAAMDPTPVIGACIHTGPSGLDVLDIDGPAAVAWLEARGLDPRDPALFRITRTTDPDRFKIPFRLTAEQRSRLPQTKVLLRVGEKDAEGKRQALELYSRKGAQVIALGFHTKSGGWYDWAGDPANICAPSEAWMEAMNALCAEVEALRGKGDPSRPPRSKGTSKGAGRWAGSGPGHPCPICGRDTSAACTRTTASDGRLLVSCYHGASFMPPEGLCKGGIITGHDGQRWAYLETYDAACIGDKSLFIDHRPLESTSEITLRSQAQQINTTSAPPKPTEQQTEDAEVTAKPKGKAGIIQPARLEHFEILRELPKRIGEPRLNIRTKEVHVDGGILCADRAVRLYLQLSNRYETWPKEATYDAVQHLAAAAEFDPVIEYLESVEATVEPLLMEEWNRLDLLLFNIDDPVAAAFLPRYFISAVARAFQPGCPARQWPVLIGEKGIGKSDLPKLLFNVPNLPEGFIDSPGDLQRDGLMKCHRGWGVELAELNGISRRADKEHLKAFLSERTDTYRAPYSRAPAAHPRRFVFWGTSNGPPMNEADPRFVCIRLPDRMLPFTAVEAVKDALWSRAVAQYRAGICWHTVTAEFKEMQAERNADHTVTDPWAGKVAEHLEFRMKAMNLPVQVPELMEELDIGMPQRTNQVAVRLTDLASSLGWVKARRRPAPGMEPRHGLWPPEG